MILVNGNWEEIRDLEDVSKVIRENYNNDLADELNRLIPNHTNEEYYGLEWELSKKEDEIRSLEDELEDREKELCEKEKEIEELEEKIRELEIELEEIE